MEKKPTSTIRQVEEPPKRTEPERQLGGPQSGLPPPYIVGSELAPYLIVGLDFGAYCLRVSTFANGAAIALKPHEYSALVEDALGMETKDTELVHSVKHCVSEGYVVKRSSERFSAAEVTARVLSVIKGRIENESERLLAKAVISVPAGFSHRQRNTLVEAAGAAEIAVLGLINEPTAIALDACYTNDLKNGKYLVVSSGAYTFEAMVVHAQNRLIEVKATRGARALCGLAVTLALVEALKSEFKGFDEAELHVAIERAKPALSVSGCAAISVQGTRFYLEQRRAAGMLAEHSQAMTALVDSVLLDAHTNKDELRGLIIGGAATKLWLVTELFNNRFPVVPTYSGNTANGAATYAALAVRQAKDWVVWDALASPVLVAQGEHVREIIAVNSPLPIVGHALLSPGADGQTTATIFQSALDTGSGVTKVVNVKVVEELQHTEAGASVDLAVTATADGTLAFAARHKVLDVNLTVEVTPVEGEGLLIDLTPDTQPRALPAALDPHEPGLTVVKIGWQWFVETVIDGSPAAHAGISVYDEILSIDGQEVNDLRNAVPYHLTGELGTIKKLTIAHAGFVYQAPVECNLACNRWQLDRLQASITDATVNDDSRHLVTALLDYAHFLTEVAASPDYAMAKKSIARAIDIGGSKLSPHDILRLRALCALCKLHIRLVLSASERDEQDIGAVNNVCEQIMEFDHQVASQTPATAQCLYDVAKRLKNLSAADEIQSTVDKLIQLAIAAVPKNQIPRAVLDQYLLLSPTQALSADAIDAIPEPSPEEEDKISRQYADELDKLLGQQMELDALESLPSDYSPEISAGRLPDIEFVKDFGLQTALSYQTLGDWWLMQETKGKEPDPVSCHLMRHACRGYIAFCGSSRQAYKISAILLTRLAAQAEKKNDMSRRALYLSILATVLAGLVDTTGCEKSVNQVRRLVTAGAKIVHMTIQDVCDVYIAGGQYSALWNFCAGQLRRLDTEAAVQRLEAAQALLALARAYAIQEDYVLCQDAYQRLLILFASDEPMHFHYLVKYAEFLVRIEDPAADAVTKEAEELGKSLGLITDETAAAWRQQFDHKRGEKRFV